MPFDELIDKFEAFWFARAERKQVDEKHEVRLREAQHEEYLARTELEAALKQYLIVLLKNETNGEIF